MLRRLLKNAGRVVTKAQLTETLAALNEDIGDKSIEVYVHRIRNKIQGYGAEIVTVHSFRLPVAADSIGASLWSKRCPTPSSLRRRLDWQLAVPLLVLFVHRRRHLVLGGAPLRRTMSTIVGSTIRCTASRGKCGFPASAPR